MADLISKDDSRFSSKLSLKLKGIATLNKESKWASGRHGSPTTSHGNGETSIIRCGHEVVEMAGNKYDTHDSRA